MMYTLNDSPARHEARAAAASQTDGTAGTAPFLVTGGTGALGGLVVRRLRKAGYSVRVLSRHSHKSDEEGIQFVTGDLAKGPGIEPAVAGVAIVVHCAGNARGNEAQTRNLVQEASRAGVRHLVYISVVGADRIPGGGALAGYYASKLAAERVVAASGVPWTTLRATQFYDLILLLARAVTKLPVVPIPAGFRFQPIDTGEVADRLVELALGAPTGLVPDLAGPRVYPAAELIRGYLQARGQHRPMVTIRLPGKAACALREGANLAPDRAVGRRTWEEFLTERVAAASGSKPRVAYDH